MVRIPVFSRARMLACALLLGLGEQMTDSARASESIPLYWLGAALFILAMGLILREAWIIGFHDGVDSVPLDGAGLASGDERAFSNEHRWNPELGAWERVE